jgi:very-short-patch-repair endonuclease
VSDAEEALYFQLKAAGLPEPVREYRFHPVRRWRSDFGFPDHRLLIEVEGGAYSQGRHTRGKGFEGDCEKYNTAQILGWTVLRYTPGMIERGEALADIERALR